MDGSLFQFFPFIVGSAFLDSSLETESNSAERFLFEFLHSGTLKVNTIMTKSLLRCISY